MSARRGFTLSELLVTILIIGIVGGAITRLLLSQTRFYDQRIRNSKVLPRYTTRRKHLNSDRRWRARREA